MVTSTRQPDPPGSLPPPPPLSELRGVNDNPPSPYLDGRPPQVCCRRLPPACCDCVLVYYQALVVDGEVN